MIADYDFMEPADATAGLMSLQVHYFLTLSKDYSLTVGGSLEKPVLRPISASLNCSTFEAIKLLVKRQTHLCMNSMILSLFRSCGSVYFSSPFSKYLTVGKPEILKRSDTALCTVASTAAKTPGLCRRYKSRQGTGKIRSID